MSIGLNQSAFVLTGAGTISLSQMFSITPGSSNPAYLVLCGLDRNEYTAGATGATGTLTGNGNTAAFAGIGGDGRGVGIVFTYNSGTGQYVNATYGSLDQLAYTASSSLNDLTDLSLFGCSSASTAASLATSPYNCIQSDPGGYLGTVGIATQPGFSGSVPAQATPGSIAAVAATFVGHAWNQDGCWVLASTIAAEAGAALPVQSSEVGLPGKPNGEWIVAFNGPAGQGGNWQSMVTAGDIIVIGNNSGLAHITTCVSGSGSSAMLVDNITYVDQYGNITNLAHDGSASDVTVAAPHAASQEFASVLTGDVVIYRLDTPVVSLSGTGASVASGATLSLSAYFSVTDPGGRPVTEYQIYDTASGDSLRVNGVTVTAHSAAAADTLSSLTGVALFGGPTPCTDTVELRAFNGSYWGDWQALAVAVSTGSSPVLAHQTANQTWPQGARVSLAIAANTFTDPQNETLAYSASLGDGSALPSWLSFDASTRTFSGTVPKSTAGTLSLKVTATDTGGLSASETFQATVPAKAPTVTGTVGVETVQEGSAFSFVLPAHLFSDPQNQTLQYAASLANGQALPNWLSFNGSTETFSGTAPYAVGLTTVKVTATDTSGLSASLAFVLSVTVPPPVLAQQTANQSWTANNRVAFTLPAGTFTAVPGQALRYMAQQSNGQALPAGLLFNGTTGSFSGVAPVKTGTYTIKVTAYETNGLSAAETFQVAVSAAAPVLAQQTGAQTWIAGRRVMFALPPGTFADPQNEALRYTAALANGGALPTGISFNPTSGTFSGTAPLAPATNTIRVTATDASGLSASETFQVAITAAAPVVTSQTPNQVWNAGQGVSLRLPSNTFTDPQGEALRYSAALSNGQKLPNGLSFNPATESFAGSAPITPETLGLTVTATNTSGLSQSESFSVTVQAAAPGAMRQLADQVWNDGSTIRFLLPAGSFADPQKSVLTYAASQISGADATSWLHFNPGAAEFTGTVPSGVVGSIGIRVTATDSYGLAASQTFGVTLVPAGFHITGVAFAGNSTEMLAFHS